MVKQHDGLVVGKRCKVYKYTGKWIRTIKEWDKLMASEIERVKKLPGTPTPWVVGARDFSDGILIYHYTIILNIALIISSML